MLQSAFLSHRIFFKSKSVCYFLNIYKPFTNIFAHSQTSKKIIYQHYCLNQVDKLILHRQNK